MRTCAAGGWVHQHACALGLARSRHGLTLTVRGRGPHACAATPARRTLTHTHACIKTVV